MYKRQDLRPVFCDELIKQELDDTTPYIDIPQEIRDFYKMYRPSPLVRAYCLEKKLDTPAKIYYKFEGNNTSGSHKLNSAIAQAYYAKKQGLKGVTTETGAGQWGTALSMACSYFDLDVYKRQALNGVDFTMNRGEFCAIVGPSGSGKSTLLNMLAGLEKPSKGQIVIAGKHIEKLKEDQLVAFRRQRVGFIFQSYNLLSTMNAVENVALPLSFRGEDRKIRLKKAKKYLKMVGLEKVEDHMPNQMSGGQQQRVGIARALVVHPEIIFADEPTGNLDSKTTMEVLKLMQKIVREQNQTLVMVTHDNHLATYADRIFHIIDGKIFKIEENHRRAGGEEDENV